MRKSRKDFEAELMAGKKTSGRFAAVEGMVAEIVARVEPNGYAEALQALREELQPVGQEIHFVELMAELSVRIRGCAYLQAEILENNMEVCSVAQGIPREQALGAAYIKDFDGPKLLDKLLRYENWLSDQFIHASRTMTRRAENRSIEEARLSAQLAKLKPCTSVIQ
jgi:hypothetical protein